MKKMKSMICIAAVLLGSVGICKAEDSLKDKLAKLEAASKSGQPERKAAAKVETAPVSTSISLAERLDGRVKTHAERLSEMETHQKGIQDFGKGLDARLTELELKFEASNAQSRAEAQKAHDALYAKLGDLERKLMSLESASAVKEAPARSPALRSRLPKVRPSRPPVWKRHLRASRKCLL